MSGSFLAVRRVPVKCLFEIKVRCIKTIDVLSLSELSSYFEFQRVVVQLDTDLCRGTVPALPCSRILGAAAQEPSLDPFCERWWLCSGCSQQQTPALGSSICVVGTV